MNNAGGATKCSRWMEAVKYPSLFIPDFDFDFLSHLSATLPIHAKQAGDISQFCGAAEMLHFVWKICKVV